MKLFEELKLRGLVKDIAGEDLEEKINNTSLTFYWGTDPTADSLHLGHYSSLVTAKRLAKAGHKPILLVGGATGLIGDPRETSEREIIDIKTVEENVISLTKQVKKIVGENTIVVNNFDWMKDFSFIKFLRDIGKHININYMLDKDIIRRRLDVGITYAEFSYTLIQGYDYLHLFKDKNVTLQAAGSDQWGNITTGIELIKKVTGENVYGFTMPLILDSTGKKFGKSEGNALWLDEEKTSSYSMYQYLINTEDSKVEEYLKVFTFLSLDEIDSIITEHNENPHLRIAQKSLAYEIIKDLHGKDAYDSAKKISEALFSGDINNLSEKDLVEAFSNTDSFNFELNHNIIDILVNNNITSSKREAREFVNNKSISVNGNKIDNIDLIITKELLLYDKYLIIRKGKKKYFIGTI